MKFFALFAILQAVILSCEPIDTSATQPANPANTPSQSASEHSSNCPAGSTSREKISLSFLYSGIEPVTTGEAEEIFNAVCMNGQSPETIGGLKKCTTHLGVEQYYSETRALAVTPARVEVPCALDFANHDSNETVNRAFSTRFGSAARDMEFFADAPNGLIVHEYIKE